MLLSVNWLKDYVDINVPAHEFGDRMIMTGSNIETIEEIGTGISGVVIGRVENLEKHPDADKLQICKVNIGAEDLLQVVTSATNVAVGDFVPVATHMAHVPALHGAPSKEEGYVIEKGTMRGVESDGMLCGPQELGIADKCAPLISKDGIWVLPGDWSEHLGEDVVEALGLHDFVIDFEITPNRPDCLCMLGMAREAAATFDETMRYPEIECAATDEDAKDYIDVEIRSDLCRRYTARVIKDVKIEQSPWWMQKRLIAAGMRPINNIVDITNFVMLEYGQPLHAFDINHLRGQKIIVDTAADGDTFTTLDGNERTLTSSMLMINDAEGPVAVAGVMGGLDSEITEETKTVVLESAAFVGSSVRLTAAALGMRTEASSRLEKGLDANNCEAAADRFCKLVEMLGCGKVLNGSVDVYPVPQTAPVVTARVSRINRVLGTDIPREEMVGYLEKLEMKVEGEGDLLVVTPPTVRVDLLEEVDYVEEIARMYGYDEIPMTLPTVPSHPFVSDSWALREQARTLLTGMGVTEIQTLSFSNQKVLDRAGVPQDAPERDMVKITNPMGEETECMRSILLPSMLDVLYTNYSRKIARVRAFEIAVTFHRNPEGDDVLPIETKDLAIGFYGEPESFFTLKGSIEKMLERLGVKDVKFEKETTNTMFHPGRCATIMAANKDGEQVLIGVMGEIHPDVLENYGIGTRVYGAEMYFDTITEIANREVHYQRLPQFPSTSRDIALVVDEEEAIGHIEDAIRNAGEVLFDDVKLFDIYRGVQVPPGKKSCAFSITYRSPEKTLTDQEADAAHQKMVEMLTSTFHAEIRV